MKKPRDELFIFAALMYMCSSVLQCSLAFSNVQPRAVRREFTHASCEWTKDLCPNITVSMSLISSACIQPVCHQACNRHCIIQHAISDVIITSQHESSDVAITSQHAASDVAITSQHAASDVAITSQHAASDVINMCVPTAVQPF